MFGKTMRVEHAWQPERQATDFYILSEGYRPTVDGGGEVSPGTTFIAKPLEFEAVGRHGTISTTGPTLRLDRDMGREFMQAMMDAAWEMGLRPSGVKDLESTLEATRFHLNDMRLLAKVRKAETKE